MLATNEKNTLKIAVSYLKPRTQAVMENIPLDYPESLNFSVLARHVKS